MSEHKMQTRGKKALTNVPTTRSESKRKHRKLSSDDSDSDSDYECESSESEDDSPLEMSNLEYQQLLLTLYPSKFQESKVEKMINSENKKITSENKKTQPKNKRDPENKKSSQSSSKKKDDCVAIIMVHNEKRRKSKNDMFNEDIDSDEESDNEDMDCDDSESEISSEESSSDEDGDENKDNDIDDDMSTYETDKADILALRNSFDLLPDSQKQTKIAKKMMDELIINEKALEERRIKHDISLKDTNTLSLKTLFRSKKNMNDLEYFHKQMSTSEQKAFLANLKCVTEHSICERPYRIDLIMSSMPISFKACAYRKMSTLRTMNPECGEYFKLKHWVDTFKLIPFEIVKTISVNIADGVDKCHDFMANAYKTLNDAVFGLGDAKLQIMQMVGQWISNPTAVGNAIAIKGPMGTGKTTLVKDGISKIMGRDFAFIALGGAADGSFLEGHSYTYEGATHGKIVDTLIKCKSMNPVIFFDELDKISDTPKGEEIIGILTHLIDTTQNSKFNDKYFTEVDFDLSKCLFIFSYNDESKVNKILLDRMHKIQTKGYTQSEKSVIADKYLIPTIINQVKFNEGDVIFNADIIQYIITHHTNAEDGVRNLKRCLDVIYMKLNLYRLMKPDTNIFTTDMPLKITFPVTLTTSMIDSLIKQENDNGSWRHMYT